MDIDNYYANNTKVINTIRRQLYLGNSLGDGQITQAKVGHNKAENTDIMVTFAYSKDITNFDIDVADAIYTIYKEGTNRSHNERSQTKKIIPIKKVTFSTRQVLCILSGDPNQDLTATLRSEIESSIERLRETNITLECALQMKEFVNSDLTGFTDRPFLELEKNDQAGSYTAKVVDENNLNEVCQHYFMPFYYYAETLREMINFRQKYLNTTGSVKDKRSSLRNNKDNIQLKRYLIRRIHTLRNFLRREKTTIEKIEKSKKGAGTSWPGNIIHFNEIVGMLSIREEDYNSTDAPRKKLKRVLKNEKAILDHYIAISYISDYEFNEKNWNITIYADPFEKQEELD